MLPVSICLPVYNEVRYIEKALEHCVTQDVAEIILSDNHSTDGTHAICERFAAQYNNIRYTRHDENLGVYENFKFTFENARQEYMLLIGGHDFLTKDVHVSRLFSLLTSDPDAVCAFCGGEHHDPDLNFFQRYVYDYADKLASDDPAERVEAIFMNLIDGTCSYGLYKTETFRELFSEGRCYPDVYTAGFHALKGKLLYDPELFLARVHPRSPTLEEMVLRRRRHFCCDRPFDVWLTLVYSLIDALDISPERRETMRTKAAERHHALYGKYEPVYKELSARERAESKRCHSNR